MGSIWWENTDMPQFPQLNGKQKTDVLIIGGGMAGLLTAYMLRQQGVSCILLEKDRICGGTTGNTTAKITIQHGLIYSRLLKQAGIYRAKNYLDANLLALQRFEELCRDIPCDFEYKDSCIYSRHDRQRLEDEVNALTKLGCPVELRTKLSIPVKTVGGAAVPRQAQFHPLRFAAFIARDLPIYEHTLVREMRGNTAVTDTGEVSAEQVVAATHFPFINKHGSYFLKLYQDRSYVLALEHAQTLDEMYLDESGTGFSFRSWDKYLLLGGGAHRTGTPGCHWHELERFAALQYPDAWEHCRWAAQDCMSLDSMPYIGQYSRRTARFFTATGFNKWGMTGSMLAAVLLTDMIMGKRHPLAETFRPSRSMLKPQLFVNAFSSARHLLTPSSRRCPHLGCALKWNSAEHSWDCPCHGSRFTEDGRVLDNPANGDMHMPERE